MRGQCAYKQNQQIPLVRLYLLSREFRFSSCIKRKSFNLPLVKINSQLLSMLGPGSHFISLVLGNRLGNKVFFFFLNHLTPEFYQLGKDDKTRFLGNWIWIFDCSLNNSYQHSFYILCTWKEKKNWVQSHKELERQPEALTSYTVT